MTHLRPIHSYWDPGGLIPRPGVTAPLQDVLSLLGLAGTPISCRKEMSMEKA